MPVGESARRLSKYQHEDLDQTLRLNLRAPMILAKSLVPSMIEKGEGAVINIGSVSGKTGEANGAAYSASKFGLIGFTQSLYEEVREYGIKVAVILPGFVDTPLIPAQPATRPQQDDSTGGRGANGSLHPGLSADLLSGGNHSAATKKSLPLIRSRR